MLFRILLTLGCLSLAAAILFAILFRERRPSIYFASERGDTNAIAQYLASGSNVNTVIRGYRSGNKPWKAPLLDIAIQNGQSETVDFLLKSGASPNEPDSMGDTPLLWVIGGSKNTVSRERRLQILKMLLALGADPNLKSSSEYRYAPLLEAASLGQSEMTSILLAAGADVTATNTIGQTALHLADNAEVAKILLAAGGDRRARQKDGMTPADMAAWAKRLNVFAVLTNAPIQNQ